MAFPEVSTLIDDFNRANENPLTGWTNNFLTGYAGNLQVFGNQATGISGTQGSAYKSTSIGPDVALFFSVPTLTTTNSHTVALVARASGSSGTLNGYVLEVDVQTGSTDNWRLQKVVNGTVTTLATGNSDLTAGDKIGLSIIGTALKGFQYTGGAWNQTAIVSFTDSTYSAAGNIGIGVGDSTWRVDDVSGGTVVSAALGAVSLLLLGAG